MAGRIALVFALLLAAFGPARADDSGDAAGVWRRFVDSLRRGDYAVAHGLFSAESRAVMPYREFVEEYGPLSPARELVLARAEGNSSRVEDNWAELWFEGTLSATGRRFRLGVALVRNEGRWGLVAARNEKVEQAEAAVRRVMARAAGSAERLRELAAGEPAMRYYRLLAEDGDLIAEPLAAGLRTFHVGGDGAVRAGRHSPPPAPEPESLPPPAEPAPPPLVNGFLPELAEPPPPLFPSLPGELAEPPMRGSRPAPAPARGAPTISLPDTIR